MIKNFYFFILFVCLILSCNKNKLVKSELNQINMNLQKIIDINYNYIENEYIKYPKKLNISYNKSLLIKSKTEQIKNLIYNNSIYNKKKLLEIYNDLVQTVKDSIFIKDIKYLKKTMFIDNDEYTNLMYDQIIQILNVEFLIKNNNFQKNSYIILNKILIGEQLITEYILNTMYRYDYHFNSIYAIASPHKNVIKLGETYISSLFISAMDTLEGFPIFVNSDKSGFEEFNKPQYDIDSIIQSNKPFFLKSNSINSDDTLYYKNGRYIYTCTPKKRGTFNYGGMIVLRHPISGNLLYYPFYCEFEVK